MGVKDLWSVIAPYAERKPISELRGKTVAIDLAGWICESQNAVDYFVHPRHYLKNLFFRTCYLIWEEVTPVFVLEGVAPLMKSQVIAKRNEIHFRGAKPKPSGKESASCEGAKTTQTTDKGRTRFNYVLKQCETLLAAMGIQCVQAPGEAEAYCAFLNKKGLVDGVISQDSDCFAYGAVRVYRNFSISTQGALAAQGGAVDIYDMRHISKQMDFGQNKVVVMALLCGCDYCPDGIGGVGRDGVMKLFHKYDEKTILNRLRSWRSETAHYTAMEMRVDDKSICSNCGHIGRTQSHTKKGCGVCRTSSGCDESLWKHERLALKTELALRKKALADAAFPNEDVVREFLREPATIPNTNLKCWKQPNMVKFVKQTGHLLQWPELYCFQKFLPIVTRWQVRNAQSAAALGGLQPKEIVKKRTVKGVPSLELIWQDATGSFKGVVPEQQLADYEKENPKGRQDLWTTVEPFHLMESAYAELVAAFQKSNEKPKKTKKTRAKANAAPLSSLENLGELITTTNEMQKSLKPKRTRKAASKKAATQPIDKFLQRQQETATVGTSAQQPLPRHKQIEMLRAQCSTPKLGGALPSDLDSDCDNLDMSDIIAGIIASRAAPLLTRHAGRTLRYEAIPANLSALLRADDACADDLDLMVQKRHLSITSSQPGSTRKAKRAALDDSFDILVNKENHRLQAYLSTAPATHLDRFKGRNRVETTVDLDDRNTSRFFDSSGPLANGHEPDAFEKLMEVSCGREPLLSDNLNDFLVISDSSDDDQALA